MNASTLPNRLEQVALISVTYIAEVTLVDKDRALVISVPQATNLMSYKICKDTFLICSLQNSHIIYRLIIRTWLH